MHRSENRRRDRIQKALNKTENRNGERENRSPVNTEGRKNMIIAALDYLEKNGENRCQVFYKTGTIKNFRWSFLPKTVIEFCNSAEHHETIIRNNAKAWLMYNSQEEINALFNMMLNQQRGKRK